MLAWRKLQAGLKGAVKPQQASKQIVQTTVTQTISGADATHYTKGIIRLATSAQINAASDDGIAISPSDLSASNYGVQVIGVLVEQGSTTLGTGDALNGNYFRIPSVCNNWDIVAVAGNVYTIGSTGTTSIQLLNVTDSVNVLSTNLTIDSGETDSLTAATAAVINTANDAVATGDQFTWHVKGVQSVTAPKGLYCEAMLRKP